MVGRLFSTHRRRSAWAAAALACLLTAPSRAECPPPREEVRVNTLTEKIQQSASVAMDRVGNFVVAWQSEVAGSGDEIRARRFDFQGQPLGEEIAVNRVTAGNQLAPGVAMDAAGNFAVAWQTLVESSFEIRARRFDARGVERGDEIAVNTTRGDTHGAPAVAMDADGGFVVAWETSFHGSFEIRARRFDARGNPQGGQIAVNAVTTSSQRFPAVAIDADGDFVVVWRSNIAGSSEVRARRFSALGVPQGDEIQVNATTAGDQLAPSVAVAQGGDFVVAWENSFEGRFEVRARRFTALGVPEGLEAAVHPGTAGNQFSPSVAMSPAGDFVVAWHDLTLGSYEIRARSFAASGTALGAEFAVNTVTTGTQKTASVALSPRGDYVVAWHTDAAGSWDIAARRGDLRCKR